MLFVRNLFLALYKVVDEYLLIIKYGCSLDFFFSLIEKMFALKSFNFKKLTEFFLQLTYG